MAPVVANTELPTPERTSSDTDSRRYLVQKSALERRKTDVIGLDKCWEGDRARSVNEVVSLNDSIIGTTGAVRAGGTDDCLVWSYPQR